MAFFKSSVIFFVLAGVAFIIGAVLILRHRVRLAVAAAVCAFLLVATGGILSYRESQMQAIQAYTAEVDAGRKQTLIRKYQEAVELLRNVSTANPDKERTARAVALLQPVASGEEADSVASECPDANVLLCYAEALQIVSSYDGHITNRNVAENEPLQKLVEAIPVPYQGTLMERIVPFRQLIENRKSEAEREAELDAENAKAHEQAMREGHYGALRPGDAEEKVTAAMGEPDRVNESQTADGVIRQYVFRHNSKYVYVYTKNGVVTEVK